MKIAHEAPICLLEDIDKVTDYSYFLVHLFEENEEYLNWARKITSSERESILDNSIFELGTAFDMHKFAKWIKDIKPTYYIIPDSLGNKEKTIELFNCFRDAYGDLPGKSMAVAQGKTYEEFVDCYKYLVDKVDKIAIPFDFTFLEDLFNSKYPAFKDRPLINTLTKLSLGRVILIDKMLSEGIIDKNKKHHLLGCFLASEFAAYKDRQKFSFIDSIDTSNPVVAGLKGEKYKLINESDWSLDYKPKEKLFTLINNDVSDLQKELIFFNIEKFKSNFTGIKS